MIHTGNDSSGDGPATAPRDIAAQPVIDAFGGIRPMAAKLGVPVSTVQGWKQRDTIPAARVESVVAAARDHGVALPSPLAQPPSGPQPGPEDTAAPAAPDDATGAGRISPGPRPGIRFSPPEDRPTDPAPADASPQPVNTPPPPPPPPTPVPPTPAVAPTRSVGVIALAALALVVAVIWPVVFGIWFAADAQEGAAPAGAAALAERLEALEQRLATDDDTGLQGRVAALQQELEALRAGDGDSPAGALDALAARVAALEQAAGTAAEPPAALTEALDSLERMVRSLEQVVTGLEDRIAAVERQVGRLEAAGDAAALDELRATVTAMQATVGQVQDELRQASDAAGSARDEALSAATALVDQAVGRLEARIARLAGADDAAAAHQSFLIALGQLESQLATTRPFADQLAALKQVAAASETLAPLAPKVEEAFAPLAEAAATGVPTLAELRASFDGIRRTVLATAETPPEDTLDEIWNELSGLVTVSRVDGAGPGTVDGVLATAERHLAAGDIAAAADAMAGLGEIGTAYAEAAADWIASARLRVAADQALAAVRQASLASFRPELAPEGDPAPAEGDGDAAR